MVGARDSRRPLAARRIQRSGSSISNSMNSSALRDQDLWVASTQALPQSRQRLHSDFLGRVHIAEFGQYTGKVHRDEVVPRMVLPSDLFGPAARGGEHVPGSRKVSRKRMVDRQAQVAAGRTTQLVFPSLVESLIHPAVDGKGGLDVANGAVLDCKVMFHRRD